MKYILYFDTQIRGQVTIEAENDNEAERIGEEMAANTLNYEELSDNGSNVPYVDTEFTDFDVVEEQIS